MAFCSGRAFAVHVCFFSGFPRDGPFIHAKQLGSGGESRQRRDADPRDRAAGIYENVTGQAAERASLTGHPYGRQVRDTHSHTING